jgi:NADPH-dependent ferric siderophore reductase
MQISRSPVHSADVVGAGTLTPRMRRVTIRSAAMIGLEIRPAQDVELHLRDITDRRVKRRYTIRHARPESGEFDLDVLLHGDGPGSTWGASAQPGDTVSFQGPRGKLELRPAAWHLLIGDESALPAIAAITEQVEPAVAVIEVAGPADELPLPTGVATHWVHRGDAVAGTADFLLPVVQALDLGNAGDGRAYLMGETRSMVALRALLEAAGFAHDAIFVKGYWNIGRPDRIAGRTPGSA